MTAEEDKSPAEKDLYQQIIGSLLFLSMRTRPDISTAVAFWSRFQNSPSTYCHRAAKRVLRYLKGTKTFGLKFESGYQTLSMFVDADFAADQEDRKSTTGYAFNVGEALVCWSSKKKKSVALSICEADSYAISISALEIVWLRGVFAEIGIVLEGPTTIWSDNQSSVTWAVG